MSGKIMENELNTIPPHVFTEYKYGFVTPMEADEAPMGLDESTVRFISAKKNEPEWMLNWRLKAFRHWLTIKDKEPQWANIKYDSIDYQDIIYYSSPKQKIAPGSLDEIDPELRRTFEKTRDLSRRTEKIKRCSSGCGNGQCFDCHHI